MKCYGNYNKRSKKCTKCEMSKYCAEAADPELLSNSQTSYEKIDYAEEFADQPNTGNQSIKPEVMYYSHKDMLELISFMVCMDSQTLQILDKKLNDPTVSFSDMARDMKVSRQAVHKYVKKRCEEIPELEPLLRNRQNKLKQGGTRNFMETVCQIKQTFRKKSEKQNTNLDSSGTLKFLTQSLDLSRMSIYRGVGNCVND